MEKDVKLNCFYLLEDFGTTMDSIELLDNAKEFLRIVMYPGKINESFVDTRIRMYENQIVKSSSGLIPDENSAIHHLKRSCSQILIWHQCTKQIIDYPPMNEIWGWKESEDGIVPVWYTCSQFPPLDKQTDTNISDDDEFETDYPNSDSYGDRSTDFNDNDVVTSSDDDNGEYSTDDSDFDDDSDGSENDL